MLAQQNSSLVLRRLFPASLAISFVADVNSYPRPCHTARSADRQSLHNRQHHSPETWFYFVVEPVEMQPMQNH